MFRWQGKRSAAPPVLPLADGASGCTFGAMENFNVFANTSLVAQTRPAWEPLLTSDEAAALLRIHPKSLLRMARSGAVKAIRCGRLWRFRQCDLAEWADEQIHSFRQPDERLEH